ncbi:MAG TPA: hypothetical protein VNI01_05060 [Elusimicrobiota bacterium]|nr:hypothetical protein [Elusimicrobiota bacterium]
MKMEQVASGACCIALGAVATAGGVSLPPRDQAAAETAGSREYAPPAEYQIQSLATAYGATQDEVRALRAAGLNWTSVEDALAIAARAQRPTSEIMAWHRKGWLWDEIANLYGFALEDVVRKDAGPVRDAVGAAPAKAPARPVKAAKPASKKTRKAAPRSDAAPAPAGDGR